MTERPPRFPARLVPVVAIILLVIHFALAVGSKTRQSTTADEIAHLTAGYTYWRFNDYRLQPENGNLPQRWAALPLAITGATFPPLEGSDYWRTSDPWILGHQFFYETGEDHFPRLMTARAMIALFSVATGALVFFWSRRLFGPAGGLVSLALYAFCPNFLAHGALVTSDICMVFLMLASVGAYWRHLNDGRMLWGWLSALSFGLACVAKFSAVLLLPMMALLAAVRIFEAAPLLAAGRRFDTRPGKAGALAVSLLGHGLVALTVIWLFFGFRYAAFNPALPGADHFIRPWEHTLSRVGWQAAVITFFAHWRLLPEAFLYGYSFVVEMSQLRGGYLDGEYSLTGWVRFFPLAFLYKTTVPVLLACAGAALCGISAWRKNKAQAQSFIRWLAPKIRSVMPLLVLFLIYGGVALITRLNIGHRHILPLYPVLFILCGVLGRLVTRQTRLVAALVLALLGWQMIEAARIYPHYLAYFNPPSGGPANGHRHLVDSSLDWGQDLPGLKIWLDGHAGEAPVYLSYFGSGQPDYYDIRARRLLFLNGFKVPHHYWELSPGLYCISATILQHVYSPIRGPWTMEHEKEYQQLRTIEPRIVAYFAHPDPQAGSDGKPTAEDWRRVATRLDVLRLARLCYYLRMIPPEASIGHSILIYRLTAEEIAATTAGSLNDWHRAIERAAARSSR